MRISSNSCGPKCTSIASLCSVLYYKFVIEVAILQKVYEKNRTLQKPHHAEDESQYARTDENFNDTNLFVGCDKGDHEDDTSRRAEIVPVFGTSSTFHKASQMKLRLAAQMRATTAGLRPFKAPRIGPMLPYFKKIRAKMMPRKNDGVTKPRVAEIAPPRPAIFMPAKVAALMPIGPGVIWEMVKMSTNSLMLSQ